MAEPQGTQRPLHNNMAVNYMKDYKNFDLDRELSKEIGPSTFAAMAEYFPDELFKMRADLGEKLEASKAGKSESGSDTKISVSVPIGAQTWFDLRKMLDMGTAGMQSQKAGIKDTKKALGALAANPLALADLSGLGRTIEWIDPRFKGQAEEDRDSFFKKLTLAKGLNQDYLGATNDYTGREMQAIESLLGGKLTQGNERSSVFEQGVSKVDSNPHMQPRDTDIPTGISAGESRARKEAQEAMSAPETSAVYENMRIIEGITNKYPPGKLPGVGRGASLLPEGVMSMWGAVAKDPSMSDGVRLRSAARDMLAAYIASVSGKVTNKEEYNRLSKILLMSTPASEEEWKQAFTDFNHKFASQLRAKIGTVSPVAKTMIDDMPPEVIRPDDLDNIQLKSGKKAPTGKSSLRDDLRRAKAKK